MAASASEGQLISNTVVVNDGLEQLAERRAVVAVQVQAGWDVYLPLVIKGD